MIEFPNPLTMFPNYKIGQRAHYLKIKVIWLERLEFGEKTCEVRKNDRDYQAGDYIFFEAVCEGKEVRETSSQWQIKHVLTSDVCDGIEPGYCVLSLRKVAEKLSASARGV